MNLQEQILKKIQKKGYHNILQMLQSPEMNENIMSEANEDRLTSPEMVECLQLSPVYTMSLASKELFHSNFWNWLMSIEPEYATVFFDDIDYKDMNVKRETGSKKVKDEETGEMIAGKRDLTIYVPEKENKTKVYIIENKLKSIPTLKQLKGYENDINRQEKEIFVKGVLTGINKPGFDLEAGWSFVSYEEIAGKIKKITKDSRNSIVVDYQKLIYEYCNMVYLISGILKAFLVETKGRWILEHKDYSLSAIRLHDIELKLKAEDFCSYLKENKLKKILTDKVKEIKEKYGVEFGIVIETGFSNNHPLVDIRCIDKDETTQFLIGIQMEGNAYRRCVVRDKNLIKDICELYKEFEEIGWFDNTFDKKTNKKVWGYETSMMPNKKYEKFNQYGDNATSNYNFVYQYYPINEKNFGEGVTYQKICERICEDMELAANLLLKYQPSKKQKCQKQS